MSSFSCFLILNLLKFIQEGDIYENNGKLFNYYANSNVIYI